MKGMPQVACDIKGIQCYSLEALMFMKVLLSFSFKINTYQELEFSNLI